MAQTAENLAEEYGISRSEADEVAVRSQRLAAEAWDAGRYADEVVPVTVGRKGRETSFDRDEHLRPDTTTEGLAKLRPHFKKDGLVTAGNASGIGDGAAALVLAGAEYAAAHGLEPLGRLVSYAVAGVPPHIMGIGPAPASRIALDKAGLSLEDMDLVEVNEAFAPQYLAVERERGLDRDEVNVDDRAQPPARDDGSADHGPPPPRVAPPRRRVRARGGLHRRRTGRGRDCGSRRLTPGLPSCRRL